MTERAFAHQVTQALAVMGRRVLRSSDVTDSKRGIYGLRALTLPRIDSTGADYLVLPKAGMRCVLARSWREVEEALDEEGCFLELKDPHAKRRADQVEQQRWMDWVGGAR